ncbi:proline-rich protein 15-like protein [Heteronotia binoei]|uniref:proline-rich protein 15-like protein n=1 Tax=Heteronotia binoei TaxID=13085 RepID=UPI002930A4EE|nr:proline-rich protein 15-like protein [Heteronotia binoei]
MTGQWVALKSCRRTIFPFLLSVSANLRTLGRTPRWRRKCFRLSSLYGSARSACKEHGVPTFLQTAAMAENNYNWWKLTFLRKKKSTPKVLYESPDIYAVASNENQQEVMLEDGGSDGTGEQKFSARLEKIVDKSTKGKHVKVSNSGRFKEKKKVRPMLSENPNLFVDGPKDEK